MSSAELSVDIAQLVSRARGGETIDAAAEGETLQARYPGLGMSAELIGKAIMRAASMMGVALDGPGGPIASPPAEKLEAANGQPAGFRLRSGAGEISDAAEAPALFGREDETPIPEGAGVAQGVVGGTASPMLLGAAEDPVLPEISTAKPAEPEREADDVQARSALGRPVAAMRRAFFGA